MNILYVVPYVPDPVRVRPFNLIRQLVRRGHRLTLATLWSNAREREFLREIETWGVRVLARPLSKRRATWNLLTTLPRPVPLQAVYCWNPDLLGLIREQVVRPGEINLVHVEHLRGARYGARLRAQLDATVQVQTATSGRPAGMVRQTYLGDRFPARPGATAFGNGISGLPFVWDAVDCISSLFEQAASRSRSPFGQLATRLDLGRTRWYEAWLVNRYDRTLVASEQDRVAFYDLLNQLSLGYAEPAARLEQRGGAEGNGRIRVLPNGVDLEYFAPPGGPRDKETIVFTGKMSYHANVTAALYLLDEVMPRVWAERPQARVQIVGQDPPPAIVSRARAQPDRVAVTGWVQDLRPFLGRATVAAAPIVYGAGIQNKVLEAMAMGAPVVTTPNGTSALDVESGREALVADEADGLALAILRLLDDAPLREKVSRGGRLYVEQNHNWDQVARQLEDIYLETLLAAKTEP